MRPSLSVVIPVYNEGAAITGWLDRVFAEVRDSTEVLAVFDSPEDTTAPFLSEYAIREPRLRPVLNTYGRGPARAIRFGIDQSEADITVVSMADGSDQPEQIEMLADLIRQGAVVAAASRYMPGGRQIGGPWLKTTLSKAAGLTLHWFAGVPIHDATSSFKGYSRAFVRNVGIESDEGFELALELVAKARRLRLAMAEIPTTWTDRTTGSSNFKLWKWLPAYLRWYLFAFGPTTTVAKLNERRKGERE
jgi:glycosyltransferase involved in cell wall biosynthesis